MIETHYEIPRSQDDIIKLIEWMETRTKGKSIEEEPYCWGARQAIEYVKLRKSNQISGGNR